MRQIFAASDLRDTDLAALYAYPSGGWLRANMVASADGAAEAGGVTSGLSSAADRHLVALLRTLADVVVVGAGTVRAEHYAPVRPHELWPDLRPGRPPTPPIAVVTGRLDLDPSSRLFTSAPPSARTIVITSAQAPADRRAALEGLADVIVAGQESVDLKAAVAALAERGHRRMLAEGGPSLLAQLAADGLLDELCLTIGPLLAGPGAERIVAGHSLGQGLPLALAHVLEDDGFLFCRYLSRTIDSERTLVSAARDGQAARSLQAAADPEFSGCSRGRWTGTLALGPCRCTPRWTSPIATPNSRSTRSTSGRRAVRSPATSCPSTGCSPARRCRWSGTS